MRYDFQTQTQKAAITHKSFFNGLHYVKQVQIRRNNEPVENKEYASQPDKNMVVYTYKIPATANDLLEVTAACNITGKKTANFKVSEQKMNE